jgi:hypothetical protein
VAENRDPDDESASDIEKTVAKPPKRVLKTSKRFDCRPAHRG